MLNIYRRLWQVNWAEQWQYRANLLMYILYWLVSPIVYLAVWMTVAGSQGSVKGLPANDFITYYMTLLIVDQFTSDITIHLLAYKIQDGTLSSELIKPIHPILTNTLVNNIAFKVLTFMALIPVWIVLFFLFRPDFGSVRAENLLLAVPALFMGFAISFLFGATITSLAFWTTRVYSVSEFFNALVLLFSGQFMPLDLMPPAVQTLAQYLPFQMMRYFPVQVILGKLPPETIWRGFAVNVAWLAILLVLFLWVWREGLKRFSAVGA
jgi:ABC-2 type transport system permease protein